MKEGSGLYNTDNHECLWICNETHFLNILERHAEQTSLCSLIRAEETEFSEVYETLKRRLTKIDALSTSKNNQIANKTTSPTIPEPLCTYR